MRFLKLIRHPKVLTFGNLIPLGGQMKHGTPLASQIFHASTDVKVKDSLDIKGNIQAFFPTIINDLVQNPDFADIPETLQWFQQVMEYNLSGGKVNRGQALVGAYYMMDPSAVHDKRKQTMAYAIGCLVEILQAYLLIIDDIMDKSITRRGKPCWYKVNNLGEAAFNDAVLLESFVYNMLTKYLKNEPCYINCLTLFHEIGLQTTLGQSLDLMCVNYDKKAKLEFFNERRYSALVKYKTSFYSFYLPVGLAMYMANISSPEAHTKAKEILLQMGYLFQVQDDYLDCFGKFEDTGKEGTDIQEGKCTWLIVTALKRASEDQYRTLRECYGSKDDKKIEKVKTIYRDLKVDEEYLKFEEKACRELEELFVKDCGEVPSSVFANFLQFIYKRRS